MGKRPSDNIFWATMFGVVSVAIGLFGMSLVWNTIGDQDRKCESSSVTEVESTSADAQPVCQIDNTCACKHTIEICLSDIESVEQARDGGANSVELCSARSDGGITPSFGLIHEVVSKLKSTGIEVHVLVRPRAGNFTYSAAEFDIIIRDVLEAKKSGANGIVVGFINNKGKVDYQRLHIIRTLCAGMILTFHRAVDIVDNLSEELEIIIAAGCDRVLTSAQCSSAGSSDGIQKMSELVALAAGRIRIIAAAGITPSNVYDVISGSGVDGVHSGSAVTGKVTNSSSSAGRSIGGAYIGLRNPMTLEITEDLNSWECVDSSLVKELVDNATRAWSDHSSSHDVLLLPQQQVDGDEELEKQREDFNQVVHPIFLTGAGIEAKLDETTISAASLSISNSDVNMQVNNTEACSDSHPLPLGDCQGSIASTEAHSHEVDGYKEIAVSERYSDLDEHNIFKDSAVDGDSEGETEEAVPASLTMSYVHVSITPPGSPKPVDTRKSAAAAAAAAHADL